MNTASSRFALASQKLLAAITLVCAPVLSAQSTAPAESSATPSPASATSDKSGNTVYVLPELVVEAEADQVVQARFLPDVVGTSINAGKKTVTLDFDALPRISGSNYRQALIQTPGLVLSEESSPLLSIGYRGLEPHRAQFTQVLKNGLPIHADQFGYPEAYYVPPLQTVDRLEFVHGGASLQYGPQPGGALNYVTHRPRTDRQLGGGTENTFAEDNTWNSYTYLDGTTDRLGYYFYYNRRETDGFRSANSDVALDAFNLTLALDATGPSRWYLTLDSYREQHGEPGGMTQAAFASGSNASTRLFDRFQLDRDSATLTWERSLSNGLFTVSAWAVDYTRSSQRQRGGGFGTTPAPFNLMTTGAAQNTFTDETQEFSTYGIDARYRHDWGQGNRHTFTSGAQLYYTDSPRVDARRNVVTGTSVVTLDSSRDVLYAPVFAENLFRFGNLSVTPGVRLETFRQSVSARFFDPVTSLPAVPPSGSKEISDVVPLFGLGLAYELPASTQVYANISQSYRPAIFTEAVPTSGASTAANDLGEGRIWQAELGYRGEPLAGLVFDTSVFFMRFDDKVGTVGASIENVGEVEYSGVEASVQYDLLRHLAANDSSAKLNVFANLTLINAEITASGNPLLVGNTPQFTPDYLARAGLVYDLPRKLKIALLGTLVDDSSANDNNAVQFDVPAYAVWDLTAEYRVGNSPLTLLAGVNNLFDESYFSRVRNDGIDPANGRNYYFGFRAEF